MFSLTGDDHDESRTDKSTIDAFFSLGTPLLTSSPSQRHNIYRSKLRILTVNCNSLQSKSKQNQLIDLIETHNPDIICGQESKLDESMKTNEIFPPTFQDQVFRKDFKAGERGVFIVIKNDILATQVDDLDSSADVVWGKVEIKGTRPLFVASVYRHTDSDPTSMEQFSSVVDKLNDTTPNAVITGDFNVPSVDWASLTVNNNPQYGHSVNQVVLDMAVQNGLSQIQNEPTRLNNTLDLVFITNMNMVNNVKVHPGMSDHNCVITDINLKVKHCTKPPRTVYRFSKGDMDAVKRDLETEFERFTKSDLSSKSVEENWNEFKTTLMSSIKKHIPQKTLGTRKDVPWMTPEIKRKIRKKQRLYNRQKNTGKANHKRKFKEIRKAVKRELNNAHNQYVQNLLDTQEPTSEEETSRVIIGRKFWNYVKSMRRENVSIATLKDEVTDKDVTHAQGKAEILSKHFESVFTAEDRDNLPDISTEQYPSMADFTITTQGIENLLKKVNPQKANGPDLIPSRVLNECAPQIAPYLAIIYNQSLSEHQLPKDWLQANICPVFKKGSRTIASNYRPISLTCVICKAMEHILFHHIIKHLDQFDILKDYQHGFRKGRSCETQLLITIEEIAKSLDNRSQVDLLVLDFSKAFDTVPHARLLKKLEHYGVDGNVHGWISSWLTNRSQRVTLDGTSSNEVNVRSGVPQGTVLGPLMFLIYINDIGENITSNLRLFADDSLVYFAIETPQDCLTLQKDLDKLSLWASKWQMTFNVTKCKTLSITRKRNPIYHQYSMNNQPLESVRNHPYLGVEVTQKLNWSNHIDHITAKANRSLSFVKRNLKRCPENIKEQAYKSLVRSHLEYASTVWSPHQKYQIDKLEAVQRKAARFIKNCWSREQGTVTKLLADLKWDTLQVRREKARLLMFYKATHGLVDIPLPDTLIPLSVRNTRQYHPKKFYPMVSNTKSYKGTFFPSTVAMWNSLPPNVLDKPNISQFRQALDHFY